MSSSDSNEDSIISETSTKKCFLNRGDFMEHIKFPENSPSLVVIPSNKEGTGFLKYCYDERHLKGKITEEEFDSTVENAAKISAKAYSKKRIMDREGIGKYTGGLIFLSCLLVMGYIILMIAASDSDTEILHYLGLALVVPSVIIMSAILFINWRKNVKYFVTFEEITKNDLDAFFEKVNTEKFKARGLEWATAQLGHFWIELRISGGGPTYSSQPKPKQAFAENSSKVERQLSEENRLVDEDEHIDRISENPSQEHPSSRRKIDDHISGKVLEVDSVSDKESNSERDSVPNLHDVQAEKREPSPSPDQNVENSKQSEKGEVFQLMEDEQELENYKQKNKEPEKLEFEKENSKRKTPQIGDGFGLEDFDLVE